MTKAVIDGAGAALQNLDFGGNAFASGAFTPGDPNFGNTWHAFNAALTRNYQYCAIQVLEKFGCVLAALDVVVESHCSIADVYVRVDI